MSILSIIALCFSCFSLGFSFAFLLISLCSKFRIKETGLNVLYSYCGDKEEKNGKEKKSNEE